MTGGLNKKFLRDPLLFFNNHFVSINPRISRLAREDNETVRLTFQEHPEESACHKHTSQNFTALVHAELTYYRALTCYKNSKPRRKSHSIITYFLPYYERSQAVLKLENASDFFITPALSGCLLAFETAENPEILHIAGDFNRQTVEDKVSRHFENKPYQIYCPLESDDYNYEVVFGFKDREEGWRFYSQKYKTLHQNMFLKTRLRPKIAGPNFHMRVSEIERISLVNPQDRVQQSLVLEPLSNTEPASSDEDSMDG